MNIYVLFGFLCEKRTRPFRRATEKARHMKEKESGYFKSVLLLTTLSLMRNSTSGIGEIYVFFKQIACHVTKVYKRDLAICTDEKRRNAAAVGIAENDELALLFGVRVFDDGKRRSARKKDVIRVFGIKLFGFVNAGKFGVLEVGNGGFFGGVAR